VRIGTYQQLLEEARRLGPRAVAVASPQEHEVLLAVADAQRQGLARFSLVGDEPLIRSLARDNGIDLTGMALIHEPDPQTSALRAMELISRGEAQIAMKGRVETKVFLQAALEKDFGLRTDHLLTHVAVFEIPNYPRLILISDAGVIINPDLEQRVEIVQNAIFVAHKLGIVEPRVAILAAVEVVNPKLAITLDAASLAKMADRGQIKGALVDGPFALDNAISVEAAQTKGIRGPVAGEADILITPDIESGNMLAKAITYFAHGIMAGVVVGARVPLVVSSRSDSHQSKLMSIALSVLLTV
jgi:phosphate butyryltransferase